MDVRERIVTRIARELHDVVAHGMSLIAVKAGTANHVLAQRPQDERVVGVAERGVSRQQDLLLEPEVRGALARPEGQERVARDVMHAVGPLLIEDLRGGEANVAADRDQRKFHPSARAGDCSTTAKSRPCFQRSSRRYS